MLAKWFESQFNKAEIIDFYLTSVRFERGVNGIISATKYFFPKKKDKSYTYEEAFFLIERLSNITSTYSEERIKSLLTRISTKDKINLIKLMSLYKEVEKNSLIKQKL